MLRGGLQLASAGTTGQRQRPTLALASVCAPQVPTGPMLIDEPTGALAGEPVPADAEPKSVWGRRYRRRVEALTEAGPSSYRVPARCGVAPAGDTVEIVRVVNGRGHGQVAGLWIRASARFCAAYQDQVKTRLPAARVFTP